MKRAGAREAKERRQRKYGDMMCAAEARKESEMR
jgi:hypothetical protein